MGACACTALVNDRLRWHSEESRPRRKKNFFSRCWQFGIATQHTETCPGLNIVVGWSKTMHAHLRSMTGCLHSWSDIVSGQCEINTYNVFQVGCPEEIKMGVVLVCTSNHCCIHLKWFPFSSGYLYNQGQLHFGPGETAEWRKAITALLLNPKQPKTDENDRKSF